MEVWWSYIKRKKPGTHITVSQNHPPTLTSLMKTDLGPKMTGKRLTALDLARHF